jgi:cbb3-type cytochrome c oxidase subunit III
MAYGYTSDPELNRSTRRLMGWGVALTFAMALVFPLYVWYEPGAREDDRAAQLESLATEGESVWSFDCAACHGTQGQGASAPALNSEQFLQSVGDDQMTQLVSVGIPGSAMSAYSQDFGGPLTSEQVKAVVTYVRSWEDGAPDNPSWRTPRGEVTLTGQELYESTCASCHAADLSGVGDFPDIGRGSEAAEDSDDRIRRQIIEGEDEMPAFGDVLSDEQIDSIIEYLREAQARGN